MRKWVRPGAKMPLIFPIDIVEEAGFRFTMNGISKRMIRKEFSLLLNMLHSFIKALLICIFTLIFGRYLESADPP